VIGVRWGLSPHASLFKLKLTISVTSNSTEFSSKCLPETRGNLLEIRPADLLDTLYLHSYVFYIILVRMHCCNVGIFSSYVVLVKGTG